ncbi:hypothetical protein QJS10_CPB18g00109 [Acorus calamus]|uniref:Proline-rich protein PRCC n=1 Tax=Acorus calamus TaxID=4465 RepID=A0AAV9CLS5_ACOCL|nr:hypothetical protein QJS10_CPB18g00109 [Acorus calamus]
MGDARRLARLEACSGVPARVVALGEARLARARARESEEEEGGRVVQVKLPLHPSLLRPPIDDDDEDDEKPSKPAKESRSEPPSKKFSLPPPKHSLCLAPPPSSDPLRRTAAVSVEADAPPPATDLAAAVETADYGGVYANYESYGGGWDAATEPPGVSDWVPTVEVGYGYGGYEGGVSEAVVAEPEMPENLKRLGKRGRGGISVSETVVVRQADLMKDRPREDQLKATGIAFGPAYQPVSSAKGKPSKLHKRKHQIGSLYFDMKQKEMELEERRSKGFLTKAETQAKYGW